MKRLICILSFLIMLAGVFLGAICFTGCDPGKVSATEEEAKVSDDYPEIPCEDMYEDIDESRDEEIGEEDIDENVHYEHVLGNGEVIWYPEKELGKYGLEYESGTFPVIVRDNKSGKLGAIDSRGDLVLECDYDMINPLDDDRFLVMKDPDAQSAHELPSGSARYGIVDAEGHQIIPCEYSDIKNTGREMIGKADLYVCAKKGKDDLYGYLSVADGSTIIEPRFKKAEDFGCDELAAVCTKEGKWGYIDRKGRLVVDARYTMATPFDGKALARVKTDNGKWAFINRKGKEVTKAKYDSYDDEIIAQDFDSGRVQEVMVRNKNGECLYGLIDEKGREILPCKYYEIADYYKGLALVNCRSLDKPFLEMVVDTKGRMVIPDKKEKDPNIETRIDPLDYGFYGVSHFDLSGDDYDCLEEVEIKREYYDRKGRKYTEDEMNAAIKKGVTAGGDKIEKAPDREAGAEGEYPYLVQEDKYIYTPENRRLQNWALVQEEDDGLSAIKNMDTGEVLTEFIFNRPYSCC